MNEQEHRRFLLETANKVDNLISDAKIEARFEEQIKVLCKMVEKYGQALESYGKDAEAGHPLRNLQAGPPKKSWVWNEYWDNFYVKNDMNVFWRPPEPVNPLLWFGLHGNPNNQRLPTHAEKLMCEYVLLDVIHDEALTSLTDKRIYLHQSYNGKWFERDKFSKELWNKYYYEKIELDVNEKRAKVERALEHVKTDLPKKPAETEQKTTPAKWRRTWTCVKEIPRWIYYLVGFLAALLTCLYFLGWLKLN